MDIQAAHSPQMEMLKIKRASQPMPLRGAHGQASEAQIRKVAQEYEAVFLSQMAAHMFEGVDQPELFGGGHAEEVYRSLLVEEYGKAMAKAGGVGVADHVARELMQMQEVQHGAGR